MHSHQEAASCAAEAAPGARRKSSARSGANLYAACYAGDGERAMALLLAGENVNYVSRANKQTPLHQCCIRGLSDVAKLLVQRGARLDHRDYYDRSPLEAARDLGHGEMVDPLLAVASEGDAPPSISHVLRPGAVGGKRFYRVGDNSLSYSRPLPSKGPAAAPARSRGAARQPLPPHR